MGIESFGGSSKNASGDKRSKKKGLEAALISSEEEITKKAAERVLTPAERLILKEKLKEVLDSKNKE